MGRLAIAFAVLTAVAGSTARTVSDGILRVSLPRGWSGAVGPGTQIVAGRPHSEAYILMASFRLASDAAMHEAQPTVPPHEVLISLGDFVLTGATLRWPRLQTLETPTHRSSKRTMSWHGRFAGRAVRLVVTFGSKPDARSFVSVDHVLASVRRVR